MEKKQERAEFIVRIDKLDFSFGNKTIFENLSLTIEKGTVRGIVGDNGVGKTTLFNILSNNLSTDTKCHFIPKASEVSFLNSEPFFYRYMTGKEYLQIIAQYKSDLIPKWNTLFELPLDEYVHDYSTGMKKKIAILGILLLDKPIIIMDEPFNGLDLRTCQIINLIIDRLKESGRTIILSSHILETVLQNSDKVSLMRKGVISKTYKRSQYGDLQSTIKGELKEKVIENIQNLIY